MLTDGEGEGSPSMGTSMTFDEMEKMSSGNAGPGAADLNKTVDGEGVPDDLKGKPVKDIVAEITRRRQEDIAAAAGAAAAQKVIAAQSAPAPAPVQVQQPETEKELTEDQLTKLYEENPLEAIRIMNAQAEKRVLKNMEGRMAPMAGGFAQMAEQEARKRYAAEFELFGDEIQKLISTLPNPALLSNPRAWDDLIGLIRGRPGNFEKILEQHKIKTVGADARTDQAMGAGFHSAPRNPPPSAPTGQLSEVQLAVAREMGMTPEEYTFWGRDTK